MHTLSSDDELKRLQMSLAQTPWLIACLCAAWCDTCEAYKLPFAELSALHPDKCFAWIDIEDQAHLVDDIDIENFPTILIQHGDSALFLGTVLPDTFQLNRLLSSFIESTQVAQTINSADEGTLGETVDTVTAGSAAGTAPDSWNLRKILMQS